MLNRQVPFRTLLQQYINCFRIKCIPCSWIKYIKMERIIDVFNNISIITTQVSITSIMILIVGNISIITMNNCCSRSLSLIYCGIPMTEIIIYSIIWLRFLSQQIYQEHPFEIELLLLVVVSSYAFQHQNHTSS